jgi:outer membrane lipoprotein carrier protein
MNKESNQMKLHVIACGLLASFLSASVLADASSDLQQRLNKVSSFHASFSQKVTDGSGANVQDGEGELWVKRPSLFNWHMTAPDESVIISDGKTLWFYNPFVEQVSASWLKNATSNTPFMLIARNQPSDWKQYNIQQQGDNFSLTPKSNDGNLKQFTITVTPSGTINQFSAIEQDGQRSSYQLKSQTNGAISPDKFTFTPPKGVTVDDQRQ